MLLAEANPDARLKGQLTGTNYRPRLRALLCSVHVLFHRDHTGSPHVFSWTWAGGWFWFSGCRYSNSATIPHTARWLLKASLSAPVSEVRPLRRRQILLRISRSISSRAAPNLLSWILMSFAIEFIKLQKHSARVAEIDIEVQDLHVRWQNGPARQPRFTVARCVDLADPVQPCTLQRPATPSS